MMTTPTCERELAILRAVQEGPWTDELRAHAAVCSSCAQLMLVAATFVEDDLVTIARPLPNATIIWWRAMAHRKQWLAQRVARPIQVLDAASGIVAIAAAARIATNMAGARWTACLAAAVAILLVAVRGLRKSA